MSSQVLVVKAEPSNRSALGQRTPELEDEGDDEDEEEKEAEYDEEGYACLPGLLLACRCLERFLISAFNRTSPAALASCSVSKSLPAKTSLDWPLV